MGLLLHTGMILLMRYLPLWVRANATSSSLPCDEQNVSEMIKCLSNQAHLLRNTNIFEWWYKQAESDLKRFIKIALASPVTLASVEKTFSGLIYILIELRLGFKEDIIEAVMLHRCNT